MNQMYLYISSTVISSKKKEDKKKVGINIRGGTIIETQIKFVYDLFLNCLDSQSNPSFNPSPDGATLP